jgi:hypothetical protein
VILKDIGAGVEKKNIPVIAANRPNLFAGAAPAVLKFVRNVLLKINGGFPTGLPGSVQTVNEYT